MWDMTAMMKKKLISNAPNVLQMLERKQIHSNNVVIDWLKQKTKQKPSKQYPHVSWHQGINLVPHTIRHNYSAL